MSIAESNTRGAELISLADEESVKHVLVNSVLELCLTRLQPSSLSLPGGIGTVLETMMIWQLLQVRHLGDTPLILVGKMWAGLVDWARGAMLSCDPPLANFEDMSIPRCVETADEAIDLIRQHHEKWPSE